VQSPWCQETTLSLEKLESQVSLLHDLGSERERKVVTGLAGLRDVLEVQVAGLGSKVEELGQDCQFVPNSLRNTIHNLRNLTIYYNI
jgi:hypothetical protein